MPEHASNATDAEANIVRRWGGRVPIVIGAIGHRDIRPADGKLAAAVRNECRKLKRQYSSSPFIVLSALAEGADRLIARIAMEELQRGPDRRAAHAGGGLRARLPDGGTRRGNSASS